MKKLSTQNILKCKYYGKSYPYKTYKTSYDITHSEFTTNNGNKTIYEYNDIISYDEPSSVRSSHSVAPPLRDEGTDMFCVFYTFGSIQHNNKISQKKYVREIDITLNDETKSIVYVIGYKHFEDDIIDMPDLHQIEIFFTDEGYKKVLQIIKKNKKI